VGIELDGTQIVAIAAFLRVINTLENIRESLAQLETSLEKRCGEAKENLERAVGETKDSIRVLEGGGLHPDAVAHLREAKRLTKKASRSLFFRKKLTREAIDEQLKARAFLVESSS
jgi:copper homeostasis protein CutC